MTERGGHTRRGLLASLGTVGASSLAGCASAPAEHSPASGDPTTPASPTTDQDAQSRFAAFVERDGTQLTVDGDRFRFSGANNTWLPVQFEPGDGVIEELLPDARDLGLTVIRTLAYGAGMEGNYQPEPREYNESKFERLDRVIWQAGVHGVRLILPLVNGYGKWFKPGMKGGMDQYVAWSDTADTHNEFYTDPEARALYKDYVEYVLTRTNSYTGVEYRNDPTICMWELANEPHLRDHEATDPEWTRGEYEAMQSWFDEMARFIKSIDENHLVSTGSEGFYGDGTFEDENARTQFLADHSSDAIDLASFHYYPGYDVEPSEWIERHATDARDELGKPAYLGEFAAVDLETRPDLFRAVYEAIIASDCTGAAFWQLIGHDGRTGELRTPSNPADDSASTRFVYYPESEDVVPLIQEYSGAIAPPTTQT